MSEPKTIPPQLSVGQIQRFHGRYIKGLPDECWPWRGCTRDGYGRVRVYNQSRGRGQGKYYGANRIAFWFHRGYWPSERVLHNCDNSLCVNPEHLYEGPQIQNIQDRVDRARSATGRQSGRHTHPERTARGSRNGRAIVSETQVLQIRAMAASGKYIFQEIADQFSLKRAGVAMIVQRKNWKHI